MSAIPVLRVFVADDEAPARKKLIRFLAREADIVVIGEAANGFDTVTAVSALRPDLLLLDIQMPGMNGFDVVDALQTTFVPRIVFVTAHDQFAIRALEIHAFDYLLKPFDEARFARTIADVRRQSQREQRSISRESLQRLLEEVGAPRDPRLLVEENGRGVLLRLHEVDWIEADRNYIQLHTAGRTYTVRGTIEAIQKKVDAAKFLRLNRSSLVRIDHIRELQKWTHGEYQVILRCGTKLMWTRRYLGRHPELLGRL